jgi:hypothetical protein
VADNRRVVLDPGTSSARRPRWWGNVWLRAGLLHPVVFVAPWVALCHLLAARSGSEIDDVAWGFEAIPLGAFASLVATAVMAARQPLTTVERVLVVLLGLVVSGVALVLGFREWVDAANLACHGTYECPF